MTLVAANSGAAKGITFQISDLFKAPKQFSARPSSTWFILFFHASYFAKHVPFRGGFKHHPKRGLENHGVSFYPHVFCDLYTGHSCSSEGRVVFFLSGDERKTNIGVVTSFITGLGAHLARGVLFFHAIFFLSGPLWLHGTGIISCMDGWFLWFSCRFLRTVRHMDPMGADRGFCKWAIGWLAEFSLLNDEQRVAFFGF